MRSRLSSYWFWAINRRLLEIKKPRGRAKSSQIKPLPATSNCNDHKTAAESTSPRQRHGPGGPEAAVLT